MAFSIFGKKNELEKLKMKDLQKARIEEEVKYDLQMADLRLANERYEGYKRAAAQPGRKEYEIERAAMEMGSWQKRKRGALQRVRQIQSRTRVVDALILVQERKDDLKRAGIWRTLERMGPEKINKGALKVATEIKQGNKTLEDIANGLDGGVDDVTIEAEKDTDEQRAIDEILSMRDAQL